MVKVLGCSCRYFSDGSQAEPTHTIVDVPQRLQYTETTHAVASVSVGIGVAELRQNEATNHKSAATQGQKTLDAWAASRAQQANPHIQNEAYQQDAKAIKVSTVQFRDVKVADKKQIRIAVAMKDFPAERLTKVPAAASQLLQVYGLPVCIVTCHADCALR